MDEITQKFEIFMRLSKNEFRDFYMLIQKLFYKEIMKQKKINMDYFTYHLGKYNYKFEKNKI